MTRKGEIYWERRKAGVCVACGVKASKSRCPFCMKKLSMATAKSSRERIMRLNERIRELEALA